MFPRYVFVTFQKDLKANASHGKSDPATTIPTFLALYIFAFVYQLVLVWDALRMKNTIQIIGLVGLNVGLLIYGSVQVDQLHDVVEDLQRDGQIDSGTWNAMHPVLIVIPCMLGLFTLCLAFGAYKLYQEFAWTIFKHISADLRMRRRYLTYQVYIALLKFDFFFCLGFGIQFVVIVGGRNDIERWVTAAAMPVTIIIMLCAVWFTRRENMIGTVIVIAVYFGGLAYFCFKLYRMYQKEKQGPYLAARTELTIFAVLTIGLLVSTIIIACMCAHNYGQGLEPYVRGGRSKETSDRLEIGSIEHGTPSSYISQAHSMPNDSYNPPRASGGRPTPRMEID